MAPKGMVQVIVVSVAVIGLSLLYYLFPAGEGGFHPRCIFLLLTGLNCPGCGSQRAASALLHGHLVPALRNNLLFVLCLPLAAYSAFVFSWNTLSARKMQQAVFYSPVFVKTVLVAVMSFWLLRNIPVRPFSWLAP